MQTGIKLHSQAVSVPVIPFPITTSFTQDYNEQFDYTPEWDQDTDTLASYLTWKSNFNSALHHNLTMTDLLSPICQFVQNELQHQLSTHSSNVKISGIQDLRESNEEMRNEILRLTETVLNKLTEQVAVLSTRHIPTSTPTVIRTVVALQQLHQKHQEKVKFRPVHPDALDPLNVSDATSVNRTQRATALCIRMKNAMAYAYQTRSVRAFSFQM
jgi:hypothetical protein